MISLIHATRGRPQKSFDTIRKWMMNAGMPGVELIVSTDQDDPTLQQYIDGYQNLRFPFTFLNLPNKSSVQAINAAAKVSRETIIMSVSDDQEPSAQWAVRLLHYTKDRADFVMKTKDGIQPIMITLPIMDRKYYERDGYIYYPGYQHLFADQELTDVAHIRKKVLTKNIYFGHRHYSRTGAAADETYRKNEATYQQGKQLYLQRKKIKFGL